jgi:membrane-bound lytic murein transglycosylase MltF
MNHVLLATVIAVTASAASLPLRGQPRDSPLIVAQATPAPPAPATSKPRQLSLAERPWTGDFEAMVERRMIRVLVPHSRTLYYNDKGRERGITAELVRDFERYINQKYAKQLGKRPITVYMIPTTRDRLLSQIVAGHGDIAAGNLTAIEERLKVVDFVAPRDRKPVREVVVTGPTAPHIATVQELSGKTVHVNPVSSYYQSVVTLNDKLTAAGKAPVKITSVPHELEDEDKLEMLNAGMFDYLVVDEWKAKIWAQVLPRVKVREDLVLRDDAYTGWAIRKNSPQLTAALEDFYKNFVKKHGVVESRIAQFNKRIQQISNNTDSVEMMRFEATLDLFEKYGSKYGFDPLMLAAQGYQESQLDQNAKSHVGAIGVMQIMPATGASLKVGDIHKIEPNIHGGVKYMDQLMTRYFPDARFTEGNRPLFAFASYNAGPGNISRMRKEAAKRGLDPDKWFNNVEIVTAEKIGIETTTYVRNIYKYYAAYKLQEEMLAQRKKAREQLSPAGK